jgi:purine nucleosidase
LKTGARTFLFALAASLPACTPRATPVAAPPAVIFDTDMWTDVDDALALSMLHTLDDRDEIMLAAVTISSDRADSAAYASLLNAFHGRADMAVGLVSGGFGEADHRARFSHWGPPPAFTSTLAARTGPDGAPLYPRPLKDGEAKPEAVAVLRQTLAAQPDGGVVIIQTGYSTNLARLLDSPPDAASPLSGAALVRQKVRLLSVMGGNFGDSTSGGHTIPKGAPEFNVQADIASAQALFARWPTPIVASGFEVGQALLFPGASMVNDFARTPGHPTAEAYLLWCEETARPVCPHDHATWDLTSVLHAARPDEGYFALSPPGRITVLDDGGVVFAEAPDGPHRHLIVDPQASARVISAMVELASQPPPGP